MLKLKGPLFAEPALHTLKAFSLMEVLVAVCIMSLSLLGIGYGMFHSEQTLKKSYYQTQALTLASSVAESAIALSASYHEKKMQNWMAKQDAAQKVMFASNPNSYSHYVGIHPHPPLIDFFQEVGGPLQTDGENSHDPTQDDVVKIFLSALHDYDDLIRQTLPEGKLQLEPNGQNIVIKVIWHVNQTPQSISLNVLLA